MKSFSCLVLLGLLVASASAGPFSHSVAEAEAKSEAHSFGAGPFGAGISSASSKATASSSAVNAAGWRPELYGISGSEAVASAKSEANAGAFGAGPFYPVGAGIAQAEAHANAEAVATGYNRPSLLRPVATPF